MTSAIAAQTCGACGRPWTGPGPLPPAARPARTGPALTLLPGQLSLVPDDQLPDPALTAGPTLGPAPAPPPEVILLVSATMPTTLCRHCVRPVISARTADGARLLVDPDRSCGGTIALAVAAGKRVPTADVVPEPDREGRADLHHDHRLTCKAKLSGARPGPRRRRRPSAVRPHPHVRAAGDDGAPDHNGHTVCASCGLLGVPGDAHHPLPEPPDPQLLDAARERDAAVLGETAQLQEDDDHAL